jgi:hypothetical protein
MPPKRTGRPRLFRDGLANVRIDFRVTAQQRVVLGRVASANGVRVSGMIRDALDSYVADCSEDEPPFVRKR